MEHDPDFRREWPPGIFPGACLLEDDPTTMTEIYRTGQVVEVETGTCLSSDHRLQNALLILEDGRLSIESCGRTDEIAACSARSPLIIGATETLNESPLVARLTAATHCTILVLFRARLLELLVADAVLRRSLAAVIARDLTSLQKLAAVIDITDGHARYKLESPCAGLRFPRGGNNNGF
ncbi:MAG: hypothetical protein AB7J13_11585 [Pyrinomonadaceae bacterium]